MNTDVEISEPRMSRKNVILSLGFLCLAIVLFSAMLIHESVTICFERRMGAINQYRQAKMDDMMARARAAAGGPLYTERKVSFVLPKCPRGGRIEVVEHIPSTSSVEESHDSHLSLEERAAAKKQYLADFQKELDTMGNREWISNQLTCSKCDSVPNMRFLKKPLIGGGTSLGNILIGIFVVLSFVFGWKHFKQNAKRSE